MARVVAAPALALLFLFVAIAAAADNSETAASVPSATPTVPKSYFTAPVIALSPAQQEEVAEAPSSEDETDPDAAGAGSPGAHYPPATGNIVVSLAPSDAPAPSESGASAFGSVRSVAAALSIAISGYFVF